MWHDKDHKHCKRFDKEGKPYCRFFYPWDAQEEPSQNDKGYFCPARKVGDELRVGYSAALLKTMESHSQIQPF
jgi:hypothetical protein